VSRPECHAGAIRFVIETAQPNNFDQFPARLSISPWRTLCPGARLDAEHPENGVRGSFVEAAKDLHVAHWATLLHLADRIGTRLRARFRPGRTVTVRVRFANLDSVTRSVTLDAPISATVSPRYHS
jgi:hypothetical protein